MNNNDELTNEIIALVSKVLRNKKLDKTNLDLSLVEDYGADSMDMVDIADSIENTYGVIISDDEVREIKTINDIINKIRSHGQKDEVSTQ